MIDRLLSACAILWPAGKSPYMPGTVGSLVAMGIAYFLMPALGQFWFWIAVLISALFGWLCAEIHERSTGKHDDKSVVIDELSGLWLCYAFFDPSLYVLIAGFILFRFFDILKPWPIGWVDRNIKGAFGTMLDDWLAGLAAACCLYFADIALRWINF
ncbi:MAG: phosphatidylglycerophosphatase A [Alphaproteobacteria bacterium]